MSAEHLQPASAAKPIHIPDSQDSERRSPYNASDAHTPITASSLSSATPPPTSFPLGKPLSRDHSPAGSPKQFAVRRKSSATGPGLHRRASEHFEDRVEVLRQTSAEKAVGEVDIRMPSDADVFVEDVANPDATSPAVPIGLSRTRSRSPLRAATSASSEPKPHHITAAEPPKLHHGHSGLCSPPTTSSPAAP